MLAKRIFIFSICVFLFALLNGCEPRTCERGEYLTPGCAEHPEPVLPEAGCYEKCEIDEDCLQGEVCTYVVIDPCGSGGCGMATCAACGAWISVCLKEELRCTDCIVYDDLQ
jgi:hypothetical protein